MPGHRRIFGLPLSKLDFTDVKLSNGSASRVPKFVSDACLRILDHIETEGLFRKAGSSSRQKEIRVSGPHNTIRTTLTHADGMFIVHFRKNWSWVLQWMTHAML